MTASAPLPKPTRRTGRWIVLAMFAFGIVATGAIWVYWKLHLAPFMPLQKALAAEFPKCSPRVDGGWAKNEDRKLPPTLRIVLSLPYPPDERDPRVPATIAKVIELTRTYIDLATYETLQIYLVYYAPERGPQQYEFVRKVSELEGNGLKEP